MHLLHRSSVFGGGKGRAPRRGVGSSPRAPPPRQHQLFSKSDSIKKRTAGAAAGGKGSKRARLRAGLAAALQDLRLGGRHKRRSSPASADGATRRAGSQEVGFEAARRAADAAASSSRREGTMERSGSSDGALLLLLLALVCVVALGRAPAVCCCTCAAWLCRGRSVTTSGKTQAPPPERRALQ